jgi:hypothetical protein
VKAILEVLFVCVHNAGRSPMAAALLDHHAAGAVHVRSAGSTPTNEINTAVREAMAEIGLDISREFPKPLMRRSCAPRTWSSPWAAATPARGLPRQALPELGAGRPRRKAPPPGPAYPQRDRHAGA